MQHSKRIRRVILWSVAWLALLHCSTLL